MTVDDMNKFVQWWSINYYFYCLSANGEYCYFFELEYNVSTYSVNCIFYPLALPSGGSNPVNMYLDPTRTMQLSISQANEAFGRLLGLIPGVYPTSNNNSTTISINSNTTVVGSEINAINLCANIVRNDIGQTVDSFYAFTGSNVSFGSNISTQAPEIIWVDCFKGRYQNLTITLKDQNNRDIQYRDANVCIMICLKEE
jgi:hypothetical protein